MSGRRDLYAILGVAPDSEDVVIKAAYRALMRRYHPDTNHDPSALSKAREINEAYEVLGDSGRRAAYDATRHSTSSSSSSTSSKKESERTTSAKPSSSQDGRSTSANTSEVETNSIARGNGFAAFATFGAIVLICLAVFVSVNDQPGSTNQLISDAPAETDSYDQYMTDDQAPILESASSTTDVVGFEIEDPKSLSSSSEPVRFSTIEAASEKFFRIMEKSGINGARRESERCHTLQEEAPTWDGLDSCAAFDFAATALDRALTSNANGDRNAYFEFQADNQTEYYKPYSYLATSRLAQIKRSSENALAQIVRRSTAAESAAASAQVEALSPAELIGSITGEIRPHWFPPEEPGTARIVTVLAFNLTKNGSLMGSPRVVSQEGVDESNTYLATLHAERAIRAVIAAAPFVLPRDQYSTWKSVRSLRFDSTL